MSDDPTTAEERAERGRALMVDMLGEELVDRIARRNTIAPNWQRWTTEVLFGDMWHDATLPLKTRSMITIAALLPTARARELENHIRAAIHANGVSVEEVLAVIQHVGFYAGWPSVGEALSIVDRIITEKKSAEV